MCTAQLQKALIVLYLERHTLEFKTSYDLQEELSIANAYVSLRVRGRAERVISIWVS